jgi:predicted RNA-binding Zn-ribbon protein involved in translation (DUF1610 family)
MALENNFVRLIDSAPKVECQRCHVEMTLRTLVPAPRTNEYKATFRCPKCGTDIPRQFTVPTA